MCGERWCVTKLCVKGGGGGGGGGCGGGGGRGGGIQNQKQEPHAKMWGTNTQCISGASYPERDAK